MRLSGHASSAVAVPLRGLSQTRARRSDNPWRQSPNRGKERHQAEGRHHQIDVVGGKPEHYDRANDPQGGAAARMRANNNGMTGSAEPQMKAR